MACANRPTNAFGHNVPLILSSLWHDNAGMSWDGYRLETLHFDRPVLNSVPVSFLLTLEGSPRRRTYIDVLQRYRPTRTVVIIHNAGFRKVAKEGVTSISQDLWHANQLAARLVPSARFALHMDRRGRCRLWLQPICPIGRLGWW